VNGQRVSPIALVLVAALTVGCGAVRAGEAEPAPGATTSAVAAPHRAAVSDAYLALAGPLNVRVRELAGRVDRARDLAAMREISLGYAAVEDEFANGLRALPVPDDLKPLVGAAIDAASQVASLNRRAAAGEDPATIGPTLRAALDVQRAALRQLRAALGLDALPGSD
jgi:hypothetical protein